MVVLLSFPTPFRESVYEKFQRKSELKKKKVEKRRMRLEEKGKKGERASELLSPAAGFGRRRSSKT